MSKQNKVISIIAVALTLFIVGLIFLVKVEQKAPVESISNIESAPLVKAINEVDYSIGDSKAPVQIIIYSNFACPFSAKFSETMKKIEQDFKDKVVISFRHYPLLNYSQAEPAAEASECAAEQGKFWEMHDKLFADNIANNMSPDQYKQDALDLGLNQEQFNQCLDNNKYADKISQQKIDGDIAGVTGTPTVFVNGNIYPGAYPFEDFTSSDNQQKKGMKSIISGLLK
ncbi:MAG: thioredoxin domain-containing protein [Patescibacteria group bacterium]|jgi:protein-disulfide isomerase